MGYLFILIGILLGIARGMEIIVISNEVHIPAILISFLIGATIIGAKNKEFYCSKCDQFLGRKKDGVTHPCPRCGSNRYYTKGG